MSSVPATSSSSSSSTNSTTSNALGGFNLKPSDFINLMVTELQNQDPTKPASSQDLLTQMSQIGSLESSDSLQTTLTSFGLQMSISSAGTLIGKNVTGLDDQGKQQTGNVLSVKVSANKAYLQLDNGAQLQVGNVTAIANATTATTGSSTSNSS